MLDKRIGEKPVALDCVVLSEHFHENDPIHHGAELWEGFASAARKQKSEHFDNVLVVLQGGRQLDRLDHEMNPQQVLSLASEAMGRS